MKRYAWIALGLVASLIWAWTAVARLPSSQTASRGIYIQFDNVFNNIDQAHGFPVAGGHQRWQWKDLEPNYDNDYRFDEIRSFVSQQASVGKKAALGIETFVGRINQSAPYGSLGVPQWLWQTYPNVALWNPRGVAPYWYTLNYLDANYKAKYQEFVYAFADWLASNSDVAANVGWVEMGVGMYSETQPSDQWVTQNWPDYAFYADDPPAGLGWSGADWQGYVNWCTDTYYHAFRVRNPSLSFIPLFLNCAPDFKGTRDSFSDYAAAKGIGLKNNGLQVDRHPYYLYGPLEKWGAVTAPGVAPIAWETYEQWLTNETELYWGLLCALDKLPDVLEPDRWLMVDHSYNKRANYVAIWDWVAPYVGVTPTTTPGIWCALRETEFPSNGEPGNFNLWLFQRTNLAGGASVAAWNVTGYKEGRYTRRTDQSSGNPYMHFQVLNPSTFFNGPGQVTVYVTYLDQGTDTWRLTYDSYTGEKTAGTVTKTNTNTWKKQSFALSDARFGNGYGPGGVGTAPDLKIDCMNNGDEYIHLIEVRKGGSGPTATPVTPTACSIQGSVSLQGRPTPPHARWSVPLTVTVCGTPRSATTDQMGNFTLSGLTPGTCDILVKNGHTLSNKRTGYTLVNGVNTINMGELKEGDANNDNTVNSSDFLLLRGSYFKSEGQPGFVDGADFNEDGVVNSSDFLLLRANYFLSGPIEVGGGGGQVGAQSLSLMATAAGTASIAIEPASTTVQEGDVFELDIRIDAGEDGVAVADVYLDLDAHNLEVTEFLDGGSLEIIATRVDHSGGAVDIAAGTFGTPVTGSFVLATVRLRAKADTQGATTPVTFSLTTPRQTVVKDAEDHNLLQTAVDGAVRIENGASYSLYLPAVLR